MFLLSLFICNFDKTIVEVNEYKRRIQKKYISINI